MSECQPGLLAAGTESERSGLMTAGFCRAESDAHEFSWPSILSHTGESTSLGTIGVGGGWVTVEASLQVS